MAAVNIRSIWGLIIVLLISGFSWLGASDVLLEIMPPVVYGGVIISAGAILLLLVFWLYIKIEEVLTRRAELRRDRQLAEIQVLQAQAEVRQKQVMTFSAPKDHQLVVRDDDPGSNYRQLHLNPSPVVNGHYENPTQQQLEIYNQYHISPRGKAAKDQPLMIEAPAPEKPLLQALANADNVLIVGGKGTGKTTLIQWLEYDRITRGQETLVLDSHATPPQWVGPVVGRGRNYGKIHRKMIDLLAMLNSRYQSRDRGQENYNPLTTFIDEFTLLPKALKSDFAFDIQTYSIPMLTEGRKVKMNCVWGIHSDRVGPMGLERVGDIVECFDVVVHLKNVQGEIYGSCNFGEGMESTKYIHPGPFAQPSIAQTQIDNPARPSPDEVKIFVIWKDMMKSDPRPSWNKLHKLISGRPTNASQAQCANLKRLFEKHNIDPKLG